MTAPWVCLVYASSFVVGDEWILMIAGLASKQVGGGLPVLETQDVQLDRLVHLADEQQAHLWTLLQEGQTCWLQPEQVQHTME